MKLDKHTHKLISFASLAMLAVAMAGCSKPPAEDESAPVLPARNPGAKKPGAAAQATAPTGGAMGGPAVKNQPGGQVRAGTAGKPGKKGAKPSTVVIAKTDPFAPPGGGAPRGAAQPGAPQAARMVIFRGPRQDPFFVSWTLPVPPPYVFDEVEPIRLASEAIETPPVKPYEVREQPEMRVSGIMTGDGVFAILESAGNKVDVVKPGSTVDLGVEGQTKRTYKVVSITKDKVRLRSQVGNVIYTQEVPLSDVAVGSPARGGAPGVGGTGAPAGFAPGGSSGPGAGFPPGGSNGPGGGRGGRGLAGPPGA